MKLSIVIPVFNIRDYLKRCIDSCLEQDMDQSEYEIICIDDGSSDGCYGILDDYALKYGNIRVYHTENQGVVKARNTGLSYATGEYVWFVDGDDWIHPNCLNYLYDRAKSENCDLVLFREKRCSDFHVVPSAPESAPAAVSDDVYHTYSDHYTTGSGFYWFGMNIIREYDIKFRPDIYYSDDTLFIAKFKSRCRKIFITEATIYYYFQRVDSVSHDVKKDIHCSCMYKLAAEYLRLSKLNYSDHSINRKMLNAYKRSMQACIRDICFYCKDKSFYSWLMDKLSAEKLYPFGVDWGNFRIDRKQSLKADLLNWIFGFVSFRPYADLCYFLFRSYRKGHGEKSFDKNLFNIE